MNYLTKLYIELYKRKQFDKIPVYEDETGSYYLSLPQLKTLEYLFDSTTFYVGYGGSGMSGKTQLECFWLMFNCLAYDDTRWMAGRSELKNLKATTLQTLHKTFEFYGLKKDVDYSFHDKESYYEFTNKSRIVCRDTKFYPSDPEMTDLGGLELTGAVLDESVENKELVINILTSRVNRWNNLKYGLNAKILEGFNPAKNHVHYRYWRPFRNNSETIDRKFVRALSSDNPHPDAREWEKNMLKTCDKRTIQRLLHGEFDYDDDDNALCNFDKINDIFTNTFVGKDMHGKPLQTQKFMSCDIAISNDAFVIVNWDGMVIEDIKSIVNISPTKIDVQSNGIVNNKIDYTPLINLLTQQAEKYKVPRSNIVYDADGIGHKLKEYFPGAIALHNNSTPFHPEYRNLKCELEYLLAEKVNNSEIYCKANITTDLKEKIIEELQMIKRDTEPGEKLGTLKKVKVKELLGRSPDIMDAIKYRLLFCITRRM
jgi:phage terminase large subunit